MTERAKRRQQERAVRLLTKLVATRWFDPSVLADTLATQESTIDRYIAGEETFPLERQLLLALLIIEQVPPLSRAGYQLRGQVVAALAFQNHLTITHEASPPRPYA